ncbi:MAG TPA: nitroreductase family protein [Methanothrix sp.]|nr:nitroreductase family protein [Methanothrix sp.]HPT37441.1 nitroreductase family protein [Methanothrix sp.]
MELMEAIRARRSIRRFLEKPVEEEKILAVLDSGRLAPSARNMQDWRFIVVRDQATRQKLAVAAKDQQFVAQAPVVIAACGTSNYIMTCGQPTYAIDVTIALDHMTLAAASLGLGTCWIGAFYEDQAKKILGVPDDVRIVALMPLGYPAEEPLPRPRKEIGDIMAWEHW